MTEGIRLNADCLWSKWGFGDGDIQHDHPDEAIAFSEYDALALAVRRHLAPLCPGVVIEEYETCHNPMRASDYEYGTNNCPPHLRDVFVIVPFDVWADMVREIEGPRRIIDGVFRVVEAAPRLEGPTP